jgi:hypothetical protein
MPQPSWQILKSRNRKQNAKEHKSCYGNEENNKESYPDEL